MSSFHGAGLSSFPGSVLADCSSLRIQLRHHFLDVFADFIFYYISDSVCFMNLCMHILAIMDSTRCSQQLLVEPSKVLSFLLGIVMHICSLSI